jgi:hypothetical protein
MTWSYVLASVGAGGKDAVRLLIGDTDTTDQQLQDEEIQYHLGRLPQPELAAAACADALAAKYARKVDTADGDTRLTYSQRSAAYHALADTLRAQAQSAGAAAPYVGGISLAEIESRQSDPDRPEDNFAVGMHDHP